MGRKELEYHGLRDHPLYNVWSAIIQRCTNKNNKDYEYYGSRGIIVCEEWINSFKSFYDFCMKNGWKQGLDVDRYYNDGNYEHGNIRFITHRSNSLNRRQLQSNNKSGYVGVHLDKISKKYITQIKFKGKVIYLGRHENIKDAVKARNDYIIKNNLQDDYKIQNI